jgi:glycosyltransferase involved in cell wall biosynthesis
VCNGCSRRNEPPCRLRLREILRPSTVVRSRCSFKTMKTANISPDAKAVRVMYILTSSFSLRLIPGQLDCLQRAGFDATIACAPGEELRKAKRDGVQTIAVPMAREISPWTDLLSVWRLARTIGSLRPTVTNVSTPKAGLLGGIAAWACRTPCRYYTLLGLRCETTTGLKRMLLLWTERIACRCAHRVICVSESLRQKAIDLHIVNADRTLVLGSGSGNGVEVERFAPKVDTLRRAAELREHLGIPAHAPVVGFVGRLTRDKGIGELVEAHLKLRKRFPAVRLLLVGDVEQGDPLPAETRRTMKAEPQIIQTGFVEDPAPYYHIMNVLAFPTHREGFANAPLEAHAAGKPVVAARATGVRDGVIDGITGILVPIGDVAALAEALELVLNDPSLAVALGSAGRERVLREFRRDRVWDAIIREYLQHLQVQGLSVPSPADANVIMTAVPTTPVVSR